MSKLSLDILKKPILVLRIKLTDKGKNTYEFSQIYIDTIKKEILGTDTKAFLRQDRFKMNENNKNTRTTNGTLAEPAMFLCSVPTVRQGGRATHSTLQAKVRSNASVQAAHAASALSEVVLSPKLASPVQNSALGRNRSLSPDCS